MARCDSFTRASCFNTAQYNALHPGNFEISVPLVQYNINPSNQKYKEIYVEDKNSFLLSNTIGATVTVNLETSVI